MYLHEITNVIGLQNQIEHTKDDHHAIKIPSREYFEIDSSVLPLIVTAIDINVKLKTNPGENANIA